MIVEEKWIIQISYQLFKFSFFLIYIYLIVELAV